MSPPSIQADDYNCPKLLLYKFSPTISRQNKLPNDEPLLFLMRGVNTGLYAAVEQQFIPLFRLFSHCNEYKKKKNSSRPADVL